MKFAVIGCGSIGQRHIGNLLTLGLDVAAYNRGPRRREEARTRFGIPTFESLDELLEAGVDVVVVASPTHLHVEHALKAARRGKHLFIEKPLSHDKKGLRLLTKEIEKRRLFAHVACNRRFHFGPRFIKDQLDSGALGRPLWSSFWGGMHLPDWHPWENYREMYSASAAMGGGAVLDFVHELDLSIWYHGWPAKVAAMLRKTGWLEIETEDICDVILGYSSGLQAAIHLDYLQKPFQRGIRVVGTEGWACWDGTREGVELFTYADDRSSWHPYPDGYEDNTMYLEQLRYFLSSMEARSSSMSDLRAGSQALELALRIKKSACNGVFT